MDKESKFKEKSDFFKLYLKIPEQRVLVFESTPKCTEASPRLGIISQVPYSISVHFNQPQSLCPRRPNEVPWERCMHKMCGLCTIGAWVFCDTKGMIGLIGLLSHHDARSRVIQPVFKVVRIVFSQGIDCFPFAVSCRMAYIVSWL